jgi:hypothetical protein
VIGNRRAELPKWQYSAPTVAPRFGFLFFPRPVPQHNRPAHEKHDHEDQEETSDGILNGADKEQPAPQGAGQAPGNDRQANNRQQRAGRVGLPGIHQVAANQQGETGGHAARRTRLAGQVLESTRIQTQLPVGFRAQRRAVRGVRTQVDGNGEYRDQPRSHEQ